MNEKIDRMCDALRSVLAGQFKGVSYIELYGTTQDLIMCGYGARLYEGLIRAMNEQCREMNTASANHVTSDGILEAGIGCWLSFRRRVMMIRDALKYVDTVYVNKAKTAAIRESAFTCFRVETSVMLGRVVESALGRIKRFRNGEIVDLSLVRYCFIMCMELGSPTDLFTAPFLATTVEYYDQHGVRDRTVPDYMKWVMDRMRLEGVLAKSVIPFNFGDFREELKNATSAELVGKPSLSLIEDETSGVIAMLEQKRCMDVCILYVSLIGVKSKNVDRFIESFGAYIVTAGSGIVQGSSDVICQLMTLRNEMNNVCILVKDDAFTVAMRKSFEIVLNVDNRCAKLLASFFHQCDKSEPTCVLVDSSMSLFRWIYEKDVFETCYREHLATRLLYSRSNDFDRMLIQKFKVECGHQFTSKLEAMCRDVAESTSDVFVLTSSNWPTMVCRNVRLPHVLQNWKSTFETEYLSKHPRRKLTWTYDHGFCEVRAVGWFGEVYDFRVSIYQATALNLFTDARRKITFRELLKETDIPIEEMKRHLISMATPRHQILIKSGLKKEFKDEDEYTVNADYASKSKKINIPLVIMPNDPVMNTDVPADVVEMRRHSMEAVVVRVMKHCESLKQTELFERCSKNLSFKPTLRDFKQRIESLIDREYVVRGEDGMLSYVVS